MLSFPELREKFGLPSRMLFRYLQLRHAVRAQFPAPMVIAPHRVERFLTTRNADRILSSVYLRLAPDEDVSLFRRWHQDVPTLEEEDWGSEVQHYLPTMISARDRYIQLKFLYRAYYTPQRLARIYPSCSERCLRCQQAAGTFFHVVWECVVIQEYWREVVAEMSNVMAVQVPLDPRVLLLGMSGLVTRAKYLKLLLFYLSFYARKAL